MYGGLSPYIIGRGRHPLSLWETMQRRIKVPSPLWGKGRMEGEEQG